MSKSTSWICSSYGKTRCKARLITKGNLVQLQQEHNHGPRPAPLGNLSCKVVTIVKQNSEKNASCSSTSVSQYF